MKVIIVMNCAPCQWKNYSYYKILQKQLAD